MVSFSAIQGASWADLDNGATEIQFRLIYEGPLPAAGNSSSRRREKHAIRCVLHRQLAQLYATIPFLNKRRVLVPRHITSPLKTHLDTIADNYSRCGFRFVPIINQLEGLACSLSILFLRRDNPGTLITSGGDIDNRIKTLFDGLRVPDGCQELEGFSPSPEENPFFCLMDDDKLITEVSVTTDRLLTPVKSNENLHDVHLIIHVKAQVVNPDLAYIEFFPH